MQIEKEASSKRSTPTLTLSPPPHTHTRTLTCTPHAHIFTSTVLSDVLRRRRQSRTAFLVEPQQNVFPTTTRQDGFRAEPRSTHSTLETQHLLGCLCCFTKVFVLHCVAVCCSVLQCVAVTIHIKHDRPGALARLPLLLHKSVRVAVRCSVLQCVAVTIHPERDQLEHALGCFHFFTKVFFLSFHFNTHVAVCSNVLQYCSVLECVTLSTRLVAFTPPHRSSFYDCILTSTFFETFTTHCITLQKITTHCNKLQPFFIPIYTFTQDLFLSLHSKIHLLRIVHNTLH